MSVASRTKLIILDRDGVLNQEANGPICHPDEWIPIPGSLEAVARLHQHGFRVVVATNQAAVARGQLDMPTLHRIHSKMMHLTEAVGGVIEAIFFCPEADDDHHCRKPNPGLFEDIACRLHVDLRGVPAVGDTWRDLVAAQAVGAQPILVRTGHGERTLREAPSLDGIRVFADLAAVADCLLGEKIKRET